MADAKHIVPFIKKSEGGHVNDPTDKGGDTNKGITYTVWKTVFGDTYDRFISMSDDDWTVIFKKLYWDPILGDQIKSQRIADIIVDWVWGSGKHYPEVDIQHILNASFGQHLTEDGNFGNVTVTSMNSVDEQKEWEAIVAKRFSFLDDITQISVNKYKEQHPDAQPLELMQHTNLKFIQGWKNRMSHLITFETTGQLV